MEQLTSAILRQSSDAVVIIGLADGRVLDINEAFFTVTGHARHELVGRPGRDLIVGLGEMVDPAAVDVLRELGSLVDVPIAFWTRSGELRVADLSALVLEVEGRRDALCTIRRVRDPTPEQRRSMARKGLYRILQSGETGPEAVTRALEVFGRCLRWELGILWRGGPRLESLHRAAIWPSQQSNPEQLEQTTRSAASPPGTETVRRVLLHGEPMWIPDAVAESRFPWAWIGAGEPMHGWFGFPALGAEGVLGMVEFVSRERRQPDAVILSMMEDFGRLFGRFLEHVEDAGVRLVDEAEMARRGPRETPPNTVPGPIRDLAGAVAAATEALERHPTLPSRVQPPVLLDELTAGMGKLNRLLESAVQDGTVEPPPPLPAGLTLKAVSRRTGIPAATLRTWEHRYKFMRPRRSPSGYRLYGEEEIARIEQIKFLVGQGIRIGAAMRAVIEEAQGNEPPDEGQQPAGQGEDGKNARVYRLSSRSHRDP
jgi:PAS domain S-box-containing protein